ncbi:MAG: tetratricopeptide repeat protein [Balneolaceae bacterium]
MKSFQTILSISLVLVMTLGLAASSQAQDEARQEAVNLYNEGQELARANDYDNAIAMFREALEVAEENQFDDIVEFVTEQLPGVYQSRATDAYRTYQSERTVESANTAIEYFQDAEEVAGEFGNEEVAQRARGAIPQLYYVRGVLEYRMEDYEGSLESLDTAIEMNPNLPAPYYQKAVVLKRVNPEDIETALEWYDQAIEAAQNANDTRTLQNAREGAHDELVFRGTNLAEERQFDRAIELLNKALEYNNSSADAHYRLAEVYNLRSNWSSALEHANQALELEGGGVTDRAKIYFELGTAYKGSGDKDNACDAFENATYGEFSDPANHELQFVLKCEGHVANSGS